MKKIGKQVICYFVGLFIISIGINFSKLSCLGITPVSSIPRACEQIWGMTLGNTTMVVYLLFVVLQFIILRDKFKLINVLGIAVTFVFSAMIDMTGTDPDAFGHLLLVVPKPDNYFSSIFYMIIGMVVCAVGVFLYLAPNWVPMPAEGLASAVSTVSGKTFGDCKTYIDTGMVVAALILQLLFCGGFSSFSGVDAVVREGTIICAVGIGQIVKLMSKKWSERVREWLSA